MNHFCEVQGTGYTGTDPTLRILSSGTTVVNLRICVHRRWQENNEWYSSETWLNLVFLNDLATDALAIQKGTQIYFSGSAADRSIDDRRSVFEITVKRWHRTGETAAPATDGDFYR